MRQVRIRAARSLALEAARCCCGATPCRSSWRRLVCCLWGAAGVAEAGVMAEVPRLACQGSSQGATPSCRCASSPPPPVVPPTARSWGGRGGGSAFILLLPVAIPYPPQPPTSALLLAQASRPQGHVTPNRPNDPIKTARFHLLSACRSPKVEQRKESTSKQFAAALGQAT